MSARLEKLHLNAVDFERDMLYHVVKVYNNDLQHTHVLQASQRMDKVILNCYKNQKNKNNLDV